MTYDPQPQPTRAYSTQSGRSTSEDQRQENAPQWGAPEQPPAMNVTPFAVSAVVVAAIAGGLAWALVLVANQLTDSLGAPINRDVPTAVIGTVLITAAGAALLALLIHIAARPGLMFVGVAVVAALITVAGQAYTSENTWQRWIGTGGTNTVLLVIVTGLLYAVGKATVNADRVRRF